jgi:hypothetical protein
LLALSAADEDNYSMLDCENACTVMFSAIRKRMKCESSTLNVSCKHMMNARFFLTGEKNCTGCLQNADTVYYFSRTNCAIKWQRQPIIQSSQNAA